MVKILNTKKEKKKGKKDLKKMSEKQKQMYNLKCCGDKEKAKEFMDLYPDPDGYLSNAWKQE